MQLKFNSKRNSGPETFSSSPGHPARPPATPLKRRAPNDENQPPLETPVSKRQKQNEAVPTTPLHLGPLLDHYAPQQRRYEDHQKFDKVCDALDDANWTFSEMMGFAFLHPGTISRSQRHSGIVSRFLRGESKVTPGNILRLWDNHPDGREERDSALNYSVDIHFSQIKPVRPALTSYAAQKCLGQVHREGAAAVKPDAGLHVSARKKANEISKLEWQRIGLSTVETVEGITREIMPLSFALMSKIAGDGPAIPQPPKPPKPKPKSKSKPALTKGGPGAREGEQVGGVEGNVANGNSEQVQEGVVGAAVVAVEAGGGAANANAKSATRRPTHVVVTHAISSLLYKRNSEARLLPLAVGLLAFAYSTPVDFMAYCSRIAVMPAHTTISTSLKLFATDQSLHIQAHGAGICTAGFIQTDNVQNYKRARDLRIGSINEMNIGLAATYCELPGINVSSLSLEDRQSRVKENKRASLTFETLYGFLNMEHLNTIIALHWLRILVDYIPELNHLQPQVSELFKARSSKISVCIAEGATPVHPLSSSGKCENVTTELKDAMFDFLSQVGHKENEYRKRLIMVGGDGLTFQRLLELQRYLQFHDDPRENLAIVEPVLAPWHTEWTDASRIFERHCDAATSPDPSTIGHSLSVIGRRIPANLSKIDYFPDIDAMYVVLDVRVLDCWRIHFGDSPDIFQYFAQLAASKELPTLEELDVKAQLLHKTYSTTRAAHMALGDVSKDSKWAESVPFGEEWVKRADESVDKRAGKHSAPNQNPEVRKLSEAYKKHELHKRRPGRVYKDTDRDDFTRGVKKLKSGRLRKWVFETTHWRGLLDEDKLDASKNLETSEEGLGEDEGGDSTQGDGTLPTFGMAEMVGGRLVVGTFTADDVCDAFDEYMAELDDEDNTN